jgi:GGDEF domain-containing protein
VDTSELAVWSAMLGGLLTLATLAISEAAVNRRVAAVRNLVFVLVASTTCVIVSGLPEVFWPAINAQTLLLLKVSLVPLCAAIALIYLDNWLGGKREDIFMHRFTVWAATTLVLASLVLTLWAAQVTPADYKRVQAVTAALCMAAVVVSLVATTRAALLGDPLARWMVLACLFLAVFVAGLTVRALQLEGFGVGTWIVTAICTLVFFLITATLTFVRGRQNRKLAHLAGLQFGADPATGLPTGSVLLSKVEHVFWRTARTRGECTVVCVNLHNLYELGEAAGHGVEHQILAAMAARIRRAAGFRCVLGLYHPRCFVLVISADKSQQSVDSTLERLRALVAKPVWVVGRDDARHEFTPQVGIGVVAADPKNTDPLEAISNAERQALGARPGPRSSPEDFAPTTW